MRTLKYVTVAIIVLSAFGFWYMISDIQAKFTEMRCGERNNIIVYWTTTKGTPSCGYYEHVVHTRPDMSDGKTRTGGRDWSFTFWFHENSYPSGIDGMYGNDSVKMVNDCELEKIKTSGIHCIRWR